MTVSFLLGGQVPLAAPAVEGFHERFPEVRLAFEQASEWTGFTVSDLLAGEMHEQGELVQSFGALRQAALIVGMHDVLAGRGVHPDAVGGLSLGGLISASLVGAVPRRELFEMLHHQRLLPPPPADSPAQGMAVAALSVDDDPADFHGERRPGIFLAADYDVVPGGDTRVIVLSGYREALEALVAEHPRKMKLLDEYVGAFHSPLVQYAADFMAPHIAQMTFRDPEAILLSAHSAAVAATADAVRGLFAENYIRPVGIKSLMTEIERIDTRVAIGLGPGLPQSPQGNAAEALRLVTVITPDQLDEVVATIRDSIQTR